MKYNELKMILSISNKFRREYQKETGMDFEQNGLIANYIKKPTWDYVCWLESRLHNLEAQKEVKDLNIKIG